MAVDIQIFKAFEESSDEYKALKKFLLPILKRYFCEEHKDITGKLTFYPNTLLFQGPTKDIDILMVGEFNNFYINVPGHNRVRIERVCTTIEAKSHVIDGINVIGQDVYVKYYNDPPKRVKKQRKEQLDLLAGFLKSAGTFSYITSLIWFYGLTKEELNEIKPLDNIAFASNSSAEDIFSLIAQQCKLSDYEAYVNCAKYNDSFFDDIKNIFSGRKQGRPLNTIKSFNLLSIEKGKILYNKSFKNGVPTVVAGRAGTGKTISLLQIATYISGELNRRCLFLTYNTALVSDIRRLLSFAPYVQTSNISVLSTQKFFRDIMIQSNVWKDTEDNTEFEKSYNRGLKELSSKELSCINNPFSDYHYIFIDEAQDWDRAEKELLLKLFDPNKVVVADGVDQFMRSNEKLDWGETQEPLTVSLRQKSNLVFFENKYSEMFNLGWKVEPNNNFSGGKITITKSYSSKKHFELKEYAELVKCTDYDFLFLVPNEMSQNGFIKINEYAKKGIMLFDGTIKKNRDEGYPDMGLSQCRVYNYASCRGLEGWITVCFRFDVLIEEKLGLNPTPEKERDVYLWSLMPLTRAVDRLIITLKNPDSKVGRVLKSIANGESIIWDID